MVKDNYFREYYYKNREKMNDCRIRSLRDMKLDVLSYYSKSNYPECVICGENRLECLSIDHIDNGGYKDPKNKGHHTYSRLKKGGYPEGFQTLCMNCQFIKRQEYMEEQKKERREKWKDEHNG